MWVWAPTGPKCSKINCTNVERKRYISYFLLIITSGRTYDVTQRVFPQPSVHCVRTLPSSCMSRAVDLVSRWLRHSLRLWQLGLWVPPNSNFSQLNCTDVERKRHISYRKWCLFHRHFINTWYYWNYSQS